MLKEIVEEGTNERSYRWVECSVCDKRMKEHQHARRGKKTRDVRGLGWDHAKEVAIVTGYHVTILAHPTP